MKVYSLSPINKIVVYGGGYNGINTVLRLQSEGFNIIALLDSQPNKIKKSPVPVMTAEEFFTTYGDTVFVFLSVQNGIMHTPIARQLRNIGFTRILFLPLCLRSTAATEMMRVWNNFLAGGFHVKIPHYECIWHVSADDFIIEKYYNDLVTVIIHQDYVRTSVSYPIEHPQHPTEAHDYLGFSIEDSVATILKNNPAYCFNEAIAKDVQGFTPQQTNFYEKAIFDLGTFFSMSAAAATYNPGERCFNLVDGWHRSHWLANNKFLGIPLRIKYSDWLSYFKEKEAQRLMDYCKELDYLPFEVKHPAFIRFPVKKQNDNKFLDLYNLLEK